MSKHESSVAERMLPGYRTIWRWHFYAGLFCIPFVLWLSVTGSIYLFKPQIERFLDRPYAHVLAPGAQRASAAAQVNTALAAVPGSNLHFYELPRSAESAVQIVVGQGTQEHRVYVNPGTLKVLSVQNEDRRPMEMVFHLHGELLMGDRGSAVVELAASWTIVMLLTGLCLWWPRQTRKVFGVFLPRLRQEGRGFWRDIHAVTGLWASALVLAFLMSGLPWAKSWGTYLQWMRGLSAQAIASSAWTTGRSAELAQREARNSAPGSMASMPGMADMPGMDMGGSGGAMPASAMEYAAIDRLLPVADSLDLAFPVQIAPPTAAKPHWVISSNAQNRTLRDQYTMDAATGAIVSHTGFAQRAFIDRLVALGISVHEGHLFGWLNQLMNLLIASSVFTLAITAVAMWWKRRPSGVLGAPPAIDRPKLSRLLLLPIVILGVALPMFGGSLILVLLIERFVLRRIPRAQRWLGLPTPLAAH